MTHHKSIEGIGMDDVRSVSTSADEADVNRDDERVVLPMGLEDEPRVTIPEKHPVMFASALGLLAMGLAAGTVAASRHIKNQRKTKE